MLEVRFTSIFYQKWRNGGQNGTKGIYTGIKKTNDLPAGFPKDSLPNFCIYQDTVSTVLKTERQMQERKHRTVFSAV